jgi:hypothetical protein
MAVHSAQLHVVNRLAYMQYRGVRQPAGAGDCRNLVRQDGFTAVNVRGHSVGNAFLRG